LHVFRIAREYDGVGQLGIERRFVAAMVGAHGFRGGHAFAENGFEGSQQLGGKRPA
jgi:hypothetical protein